VEEDAIMIGQDYRKFMHHVLDLHLIIQDGRGDSPEADQVRELSSDHWDKMTDKEKRAARCWSALMAEFQAYRRGDPIRRLAHFVREDKS
jgi:hypothetical protein